MKKIVSFLLKQYKKMSGERKIRLALELSEMVRQIRKESLKNRRKIHGA